MTHFTLIPTTPRVYVSSQTYAWAARDPKVENVGAPTGGPLAINTLSGDARNWNEATPREFKPFPLVDVTTETYDSHPGWPFQRRIRGSETPALSAKSVSGWDELFIGKCRTCGRCDYRKTGHWFRFQPRDVDSDFSVEETNP